MANWIIVLTLLANALSSINSGLYAAAESPPLECNPNPVTCNKPHEIQGCRNACPPRTCDAIGRQYNCPLVAQVCISECVCDSGFYRNNDGACVPIEECPNICPRQNEEYGCVTNCAPRTCEASDIIIRCLYVINPSNCTRECRCKPGYYRNKIGDCISKEQCDQCRGPHEFFSCGGACDNVCSTLSQQNQTHCPIINIKCNPMCYCEDGYARDANNICIPIATCPEPICGINEVYDECPAPCPPRRCDVDERVILCVIPPKPGSPECKPGCRCADGYYRNNKGVCVTRDQCEPICGINEVYDECPAPCPPKRCDVDERLIDCAPPPNPGDPECEPGCRCADGYYRNNDGVCVTKDECEPPIVCGPDEDFDGCVNGGCGRWNCSQQGIICIDLIEGACRPGCRCKEGLLRTDDGICVPSDQCPTNTQCTGLNEEYGCNVCGPESCAFRNFQCLIAIDPATCERSCTCKSGYYRNAIGECISAEECDQCSGAHEFFSCGPECDNECSTLGVQNRTNCPIINVQCNKKCYCEDGYSRDDNDTCVPNDQCPALPQCGINEEYVKCKDSVCRAQSCSDLGYPLPCLQALGNSDDSKCNQGPGCVCQQGYVRDENGVCISEKECPSCGGDTNAESGCGVFCETCENYNKSVACPLICQLNGCQCRQGFIYDTTIKKCVLPQNCPNTQCPGANQEYGCALCVPQTCSTRRLRCLIRINPATCKRTCRCKSGYYKNAIGECISAAECDQCSGAHEFFSCGPECDNECSTLGVQNRTNCPIINVQCNKKCYCEDGYSRDDNDTCVPNDQCPGSPQCGINEEYVKCKDSVCRAQSCSDLGNPLPCQQTLGENGDNKCNQGSGCVCQQGYVRDENGVCISDKECPSCAGDPNAESGCGVFCETCQNYNQSVGCITLCELNGCQCRKGYIYDTTIKKCVLPENCPNPICTGSNEEYGCALCVPQTCSSRGLRCLIPVNPDTCKLTCRCKPGYYKNAIGECISAEECDQCSGAHEFFSCGPECDNECSTLGVQNRTNCPIINVQCNKKCYCEDGYSRDDNDSCVPNDQCPALPQCGINEEYVKCKDSVCRAQSCSDLGYPLPCLQALGNSDDSKCNQGPGCVCQQGYVRDENGVCISEKECPSCGGDPNAESGCGVFCETCQNYNRSVACPLFCKFNGCQCRRGYIYDTAIKRCVLPQNCNSQCKQNEIYVDCPIAQCRPMKCSEVGFPVACPKYRTCPSKPGCVCDHGYVKDDSGICIPIAQCPSCGGDENAVSGCGTNCNQKCSKKPAPCPEICAINGCDCKPGYLFDENLKKCVQPDQCSVQCKKNEIYVDCPESQCRPTNCSEVGFPKICPQYYVCPSKPGCVCANGYVRGNCGNCIPIKQCLSCGGDDNAVSGCGTYCNNRCSRKPILCPKICKVNSCDCKPGFLLDETCNKCVLPEECPENTNDDINAQGQLFEGNGVFTGNFLYEIVKKNPGQSVTASPFSILFLLAQLALYATGTAKAQLLSPLNFNSTGQIRPTILPLLLSFDSEQNITFTLAEKVYGSENYPFSDNFKKDTKEIFLAEAQNLDFTDSAESAKIINDWVASHTNNLIQDLVPKEALNANTRLVMVNAIYFKGNWQKAFNKENTKTKDFYVSKSKTISVEMMNLESSLRYGTLPESNSQMVELPYKNTNFSFLVILPPKTDDGLNNLLDEQRNFSKINTGIQQLQYTKVILSLPKFRIDTTTDLIDILKKPSINITEIFNPGNSGLEGILKNPEKLYVTDGTQKAVIIVNEEGAEAAAANAIVGAASSGSDQLPKVIIFNADHPFIYHILYKGTSMFCGLFSG